MFQALNEDRLLAIRLRGKAGAQHAGKVCRIARIDALEGGKEVLVAICADNEAESVVKIPLREAARCYVVEGARRSVNALPLEEHLSQVCAGFIDNWPRSAAQRDAILAAWLKSDDACQRLPPRERHWLEDARIWLKLEAIRSRGTEVFSTTEFFTCLRKWLAADRRLWGSRSTRRRRADRTWRVRIFPAAQPVSFLDELQRAWAWAGTSAATTASGVVGFRPYLTRALAIHWFRLLGDTSLSTALWGDADPRQAGVWLQIVRRKPPTSSRRATAMATIRELSNPAGVQVVLPFTTSEHGVPESREFLLKMSLRHPSLAAFRGATRRVRRRLTTHLGDVAWALGRHFRQHPMNVSANRRLLFDNARTFRLWLEAASANDLETSLQLVADSWRHAGKPQLHREARQPVESITAKWLCTVSRSVGVPVKQSPRKRARAPFVRIARIRLRRSMTVLGPLVRRAAAFAWAKLRQQSHKIWFMTVAVLLLLFLSDH